MSASRRHLGKWRTNGPASLAALGTLDGLERAHDGPIPATLLAAAERASRPRPIVPRRPTAPTDRLTRCAYRLARCRQRLREIRKSGLDHDSLCTAHAVIQRRCRQAFVLSAIDQLQVRASVERITHQRRLRDRTTRRIPMTREKAS